MPHSIKSSLPMPKNNSLLPKKRNTPSLSLDKVHGECLINQNINKPTSKNNHPTKYDCGINNSPDGGWAFTLLRQCARAIFNKSPSTSQQLLWLLNELASPYGDRDQRLAYYFLQALFAKANRTGPQCYKTLKLVAEKNYYCFDTYMKLMLKFQEVSPWTTFGHVASNGAIMEALEGIGETINKLHIIDLSNTLCTQWPTLLEALALRNYDDTPCLKLSLVVTTSLEKSIIKEISQRMEKFARLMGIPLKKLQVISGLDNLGDLRKEDLGLEDGEVIVVNCVQALQRVEVNKREAMINMIRSIKPRVVTIVEEEANFTTLRSHDDGNFIKCFEECLRFFRLYYDMLEESFPPISNERLKLERERSRNIVRILACDDEEITEEYHQMEKASQWTKRLKQAFCPFHYSDEVIGDVKALLRRYKVGNWDVTLPSTDIDQVGIHLKWREEPVVWASAWKCS